MAGAPPPARLLRRIDADVARAVRGRKRIVIAFSGGLGSLVVAALARKRCDLACEVIGLPGASDAEAARIAETFLDYPVHAVRPPPRLVLRTARALAVRDLRLSTAEVLSLVPLLLIVARHPKDRAVSGFGLTWDSTCVRSHLESAHAHLPGLHGARAPPLSRHQLLALADLLGLPESFSRAARRSPAEGSGVGPAVRAAAHARHVSVERLLRPPVQLRENQ